MFTYIVVGILLLLLAYVVFYVVELLKVLIKYLRVLLPLLCDICDRLRKEQDAVDALLLNPTSIFHSVEGVTKTIEEIVTVGKQLKNLWPRKQSVSSLPDDELDQ